MVTAVLWSLRARLTVWHCGIVVMVAKASTEVVAPGMLT